MPTKLKNEKLQNDIESRFSPDEADLAISLLEIIESSAGEPDAMLMKKVASECYRKKGDN